MAVSDIEAVLFFLRKNGLSDSESALMEDILEKSHLGSVDLESFVFPMDPPPPPIRIPSSRCLPILIAADGLDFGSDSSDEFVSPQGSSTADFCSSEFTNPYGVGTGSSSPSSSDRLSQFGTARDYHDLDLQDNFNLYGENDDDDYSMPPCLCSPDSFAGPSEDKFIMTLETEKLTDCWINADHITEQFMFQEKTGSVDQPWPSDLTTLHNAKEDLLLTTYCNLDQTVECSIQDDKAADSVYALHCGRFAESVETCDGDHRDCGVKKNYGFQRSAANENVKERNSVPEHKNDKDFACSINRISANDWAENLETDSVDNEMVNKECSLVGKKGSEARKENKMNGNPNSSVTIADEEGGDVSNELLIYGKNEDEYEVFNLRIVHRKNRTGFEEHKEFPIILSSIVAGRYYITEYLGSAAFSKVVQAHDLHTGVNVCLKIIKNDKDFFDQSLDEIKLLKFVNKHDPGDEHHILRLYDYFYYQEHLIIVCELLRANLYEFQKYNLESGGEPYFTLSRLQIITRQCLEALEYLHALGIIHCDLKPENILMKSYRKCEIKVIDLGSSCFQTDNLCLYVQSRSYRAPEVMLGLPYDQKIDLWSLGCILAELCSGEVLFPNEGVVLILARMIGMLGPVDMEMLIEGQEAHKYFTNEYDLYLINEETNQLEYIMPEESSLQSQLQVSDIKFINFVRKLLEINPQRRLSAAEALQHPWLSQSY